MNTLILAASEGSPERFVNLDIHPWEWGALVLFIAFLLVFDLLVVHRKPHEIKFKEAAIESAIWISIGIAFTGVVYYLGKTSGVGPDGAHGVDVGAKAAGEYISGFLLEKSLSIDNVFVWAVIFNYFAVPPKYQFRTLFWGIFGALVLRAAFIFAGSALINAFSVTLLVFGAILIYTAQKIAFHGETEVDPDKSIVLRAVRKIVPSTEKYDGQHMFTRIDGKRLATPLFAVLVMVETTDVVFAVDSVPAIFGVANETFIVFSSNAFAILGLRALFFCLNGLQDKFRYLNYGLGAILAFVGVKMILTFTGESIDFPTEDFHFPTWLSLTTIVTILTVTIVASLMADRRDPTTPDSPDDVPPPGAPGPDAGQAAADGVVGNRDVGGKNRVTAGVLGIVLGGFGVHNFYLGRPLRGVLQIVITVVTLGFGGLWGFIEGIMILTGGIDTDGRGRPLVDRSASGRSPRSPEEELVGVGSPSARPTAGPLSPDGVVGAEDSDPTD